MASLVLFGQVTLDDVLAQVAEDGLDYPAFMKTTTPLLAAAGLLSTDDDANFVRAILEENIVSQADPVWSTLHNRLVHPRSYLAHRACPIDFRALYKSVKDRYATVVMPLARTLLCKVEKCPWDKATMPRGTLGAGTSVDDLVEDIAALIIATPGGRSFLGRARTERALAVLATSLASVLRDEACQRSPANAKHRLVRPDMYEAAVRSMKLERHFQIIRRLLELDHNGHIPMDVRWPNPSDPARSLGFLEYRGQYLTMGPLPTIEFL